MIPIVHGLLKQGHQVILGGDGDALKLISDEFPGLKTIHIPDLKLCFRNKITTLNLIALIPKIIYNTIKEHHFLKKPEILNSIDVIVSDNRYGLWNKEIKSIFITHQLMAKLPRYFIFLEYFVHLLIKAAVGKYDECWIPDHKEKSICLSGDLGHKYALPTNAKFIGPLSRYSVINEIETNRRFDIVAILSGPEPLRSTLEKAIKFSLRKTKFSTLIIQGKPGENKGIITEGNICVTPGLSPDAIKAYLKKSTYIICRSGYTSIMDLKYLQKKALLIPTPGQTEQEYLADYHSKVGEHISPKKIHLKSIDIVDFCIQKFGL